MKHTHIMRCLLASIRENLLYNSEEVDVSTNYVGEGKFALTKLLIKRFSSSVVLQQSIKVHGKQFVIPFREMHHTIPASVPISVRMRLI